MADKEFDVKSFLASFDAEYNPPAAAVPVEEKAAPVAQDTTPQDAPAPEEPEATPEEEASPEPVAEPETEPKPAETSAKEPVVKESEPKPAPVPEPVNDPDIHKRNEAFKKLREEKEKLEQSDKFLSDLASQYGVTKDELVKKFKDDQLAKQAQAQGMSVEQLRRMQQLEQQVASIQTKYQQETFNFEAERLVQKYNIPANEINNVFAKIGQLGIDVLANPKLLEVAYKALNYDVAVQKGRQAQLQETKKRRETAASPSLGTKGTNVDTSATDMDTEIDAFLKEKIGIKK